MIYNFFTSILFLLFTVSAPTTTSTIKLKKETSAPVIAENTSAPTAEMLYDNLKANSFALPSLESFTVAFNGFTKLKEAGKIKKVVNHRN